MINVYMKTCGWSVWKKFHKTSRRTDYILFIYKEVIYKKGVAGCSKSSESSVLDF